jgi:hypothetical protein
MISKQLYPSWSLFFSWGGFVFLTINFFTGILLSNINMQTFITVNCIAFILLAFTLYPTVYLSVKYNINYAQAISKFVSIKSIRMLLILLVVCINIGWYSIQLSAVQNMIANIFNLHSSITIIFISYLFAYGSYKFEYRWLQYFSMTTMVLFLLYLLLFFFNTSMLQTEPAVSNTSNSVFSLIIMLYGTWAFSSSTIVMDIAKYTTNFKQSYLYILLATICSNFLLITLGYFFAKYTNINSFEEFVMAIGISFGFIIFIMNIWSTNDSNFFSSMNALERLNIKKKYTFIVLPLISALLSVSYKNDLFNIIGSWLKIMGWVAIPLTIFWWYTLVTKKDINLLSNTINKNFAR